MQIHILQNLLLKRELSFSFIVLVFTVSMSEKFFAQIVTLESF